MTRVFLAFLAALALGAPAAAAKLKVVATFSIVGDMVECIAQGRADVTTLVGPDADAHVFEPTPADARAVKAAQLVFANGLGFEPWLARMMKSTGSHARLVSLTDRIPHIRAHDPHAWQDPANGRTYYENIRDAFIAADPAPARALAYDEFAGVCIIELKRIEGAIRKAFATIPKTRRRAITSHGAFGYFGDAYDIEFIAPLGVSTEAQASAKGVGRLIQQIRREKIRAVFIESITDPRLMEQIARETGVRVGGRLYSDALSTKDGVAPTYPAMLNHNAGLLTKAMAPGL